MRLVDAGFRSDFGGGTNPPRADPDRGRQRIHRRTTGFPPVGARPRPCPHEPGRAAACCEVSGRPRRRRRSAGSRDAGAGARRGRGRVLPCAFDGRRRGGLRRAGQASGPRLCAGGRASRRVPDRLPRRPGRRRGQPLAPPDQPPRDGRRAGERRRAGHGVPGGGDHRLRQRVVRDPAPPHRASAGHDHASLGWHPLPADRHRRRPGLSRGCPGPRRGHRDRRDRRARRPLVRRHDADLRPPAGPPPPDDPRPRIDRAIHLVHAPDRSADCRTPGFAYAWAYEAINHDIGGEAVLAPSQVSKDGTTSWSCGGTPAPAGTDGRSPPRSPGSAPETASRQARA